MGITKTASYTSQQIRLARLAKAFGHPARVAIVEHLLDVDRCICGDLVIELPLSQPTVSQHLRELKSAGLITGSAVGNSVCYCINRDALDELTTYFHDLETRLTDNNSCRC